MSGQFSEQKQRMLRGELYLARDPELEADSRRCTELLARFNDVHAVVGAGAVVTKDLPPGVLAVGNPARVVRALT